MSCRVLTLVALLVLAPIDSALARMSVLYELVGTVNAVVAAIADASHLNGDVDGLYQQQPNAVAPGVGAARQVGKLSSGEGSNVTSTILGRSADEMADAFRTVTNASAAKMVFLDEVGTSLRSTGPSAADAANLSVAITTLASESYPRPAGELPPGARCPAEPVCVTTRARRVHAYVRFPQTLVAFPANWTAAWDALPKLGGIWLEAYGGRVNPQTPWVEEQWLAWTRRFRAEFVRRGGDPARLHVLMTATGGARSEALQWRWARTGAACSVLANGPGAYRLSNDALGGSTNTASPNEWVAQFRSVFTPGVTAFIPDGATLPPDVAPSSIECVPAHRLSEATTPTASALAGVLALPRTGLTLPVAASPETIPVGVTTTVTVALAGGVGGIAERLGAGVGPGGFWALASARIGASGAGLPVGTGAAVGDDGAATLTLAPTQPGPITLTLTGLNGVALRAATTQTRPGGQTAVLDIALSVQCATRRVPGEPLEQGTGAACEDTLDPLDAPTLEQIIASPLAWSLGPIAIQQQLAAEEPPLLT